MVRSSTSMKKQRQAEDSKEQNPQVAERKRLKKIAFTNNILSETPAKSNRLLDPSKTVLKHHGKDIVKKSQRKNRFLFAFPGLISPISGGRIGELKDLGTKNPILYLDFPQGRMKLFGTIVYPKNRYLTLQFSKGGKNVMCEDNFDNVIVFSDAWWIGRKDENPEEIRLDFPMELTEEQQVVYDFKGGAGSTSRVNSIPMTSTKEQIHKTETHDYPLDGENNHKNMQVPPLRHSERTARKTYKFAENSSSDDSVKSGPEMPEHDEIEVMEVHTPKGQHGSDTKENLHTLSVDIKNKDYATSTPIVKPKKESASLTTTKKLSDSISESAAKEALRSNRGSLVQATISTLFKKVEEKRTPRTSKKSSSTKVSSPTLQKAGSKRNINEDGGSRKKAKNIEGKSSGRNNKAKTEALQVLSDEDEDIEEFSSSSKDTSASDEDWVA